MSLTANMYHFTFKPTCISQIRCIFCCEELLRLPFNSQLGTFIFADDILLGYRNPNWPFSSIFFDAMPKFFHLNATYQDLISLPIKIRTFFLSEDHQQKNKWFGQKMLKKWRGFFQISWKWLGLSKQFNTTFEAIFSFSL